MSFKNNAKAGSRGILGLVMSNEQQEQELEAQQEIQPLVEGVTPEGESEIIETNASTDEAEAVTDEFQSEGEILEESDSALEAWEVLLFTMEAFSRTGGIDSRAATFYNLNQAQIYNRLGAEFSAHDAVTVESFKAQSGRQSATSFALEEGESKFKEAVKAIWEFIKKWCRKLGDLAAAWLTATGRTKRRAQAMSEKAGDAEFGYKLNEKEQKRYGAIFWNGSSVFSVEKASEVLKDQCSKFKEGQFADQTITVMKEISDGIDTNAKKNIFSRMLGWLKNFFGGNYSKYINGFSTDIKKDTSVKSQWDKGEGDYYGGEILPGGMRLVFFSSKLEENQSDDNVAFPNVSGDFIRFSKAPDGTKLTDAGVPHSAAEVTKICTNVVSVCENRANASAAIKEFTKKANSQIEKIDTKIKSIKDAGAAASAAARRVASFFRSLFSNLAKPFGALARYAISTSSQILDVCALSMKKSKDGKDSDDKKD